jgi:hypothetical protein
VAVNGGNAGSERFETRREFGNAHDFLRRAESLQAVLIDQDDEIIQPPAHGEIERLPAGTFLPFAVGAQAIHPARRSFVPQRQGQPRRQRGAVAQAAGREKQAGNAVARRMPGQNRVLAGKRAENLIGQQALGPQGYIQRSGGMPLGQYEAVGAGHDRQMQRQHGIQAGEIAADMPGVCLMVQTQKPQPGRGQPFGKIRRKRLVRHCCLSGKLTSIHHRALAGESCRSLSFT